MRSKILDRDAWVVAAWPHIYHSHRNGDQKFSVTRFEVVGLKGFLFARCRRSAQQSGRRERTRYREMPC